MGCVQSNSKSSKPNQNPQPVAVGDGEKTILAGEPVAKAELQPESKETGTATIVEEDGAKSAGGEVSKDAKAVDDEVSKDGVKGSATITAEAQASTEKGTDDAQAAGDEAPKGSAALADEGKPTTRDLKEDVQVDADGPNDDEKGNSANADLVNVNTVPTEPKQDGLSTEGENQVVDVTDTAKDDASKRTVCSLLGFTC